MSLLLSAQVIGRCLLITRNFTCRDVARSINVQLAVARPLNEYFSAMLAFDPERRAPIDRKTRNLRRRSLLGAKCKVPPVEFTRLRISGTCGFPPLAGSVNPRRSAARSALAYQFLSHVSRVSATANVNAYKSHPSPPSPLPSPRAGRYYSRGRSSQSGVLPDYNVCR